MRRIVVTLGLVLASSSVLAQSPAPTPSLPEGVVISGSIRTRLESWDWFSADANGDYVFSGSIFRLAVKQTRRRFAWQLEVAAPVLLGLPDDATAPGAQGQLGLGASYFAANDGKRNTAGLFVKQGTLAWRDLAGTPGQSLRVGRMEFADGAEATPKDRTLAVLARDRIAQRLIGPFGFSHVGRSFDGVEYAIDRPTWNVTALAARPTQGVFQVNGWKELDVNVYYGAVTRQVRWGAGAGEWRIFGLGYSDYRDGAVKTDNRPVAIRRADTGRIDLFTFGAHYLGALKIGPGTADVLLWGAAQTGAWGALSQRSGAFAAEAGWQPAGAAALHPWIRVGYDWGSGDGNASDGTHGTFFQVLPTPRLYARFPFFNMMNTADAFAELILRPSPTLAIRADAHALRLADSADLWYAGGGAFEPDTFGYAGRPANGHRGLATLLDVSADITVNPCAAIVAYAGRALGGDVVSAIYPLGSNATYGYLEVTWRF
jgi:hypothetical protein